MAECEHSRLIDREGRVCDKCQYCGQDWSVCEMEAERDTLRAALSDALGAMEAARSELCDFDVPLGDNCPVHSDGCNMRKTCAALARLDGEVKG